jgi:hypothetical protein
MRNSGIAAITLAVLAQAAFAKDGPTMKPGKWEVKTVQKNSMMKQEKVTDKTECVKEDKNPLEAIMEAGKCKVSNQETKGHTVSWDMNCGDQYSATGHGTFTADGDSGEGVLDMKMKLQGIEVSVQNTWAGKRVGDCD